MEEQLLETWAIHDRINRYLLAAIPPEALSAVSASKGRSVAEQLAHVHNVRLMWLKQAAPDLLEGLEKIEKEQANDAAGLKAPCTLKGSFCLAGRFQPRRTARSSSITMLKLF